LTTAIGRVTGRPSRAEDKTLRAKANRRSAPT
jgi:hypothetical protein